MPEGNVLLAEGETLEDVLGQTTPTGVLGEAEDKMFQFFVEGHSVDEFIEKLGVDVELARTFGEERNADALTGAMIGYLAAQIAAGNDPFAESGD